MADKLDGLLAQTLRARYFPRMPKRTLSEKRPYLLLSVVAAFAYYYLQASNLPELYLIPIKGSACAFLAIYAWHRHGSRSAQLLAAAMAVAAMADMGMQMDLRVGGALFLVFHLIVITMLARHKRGALEGGHGFFFIALLLGTPFAAYFLPSDDAIKIAVAVYALALGAMAASAWASDFPRYRVAAGAMLFVVSDMLIFAGLGPLSGSRWPDYFIWPIYYLGQFLITVGVITTLRKRQPELRSIRGGRDTVH